MKLKRSALFIISFLAVCLAALILIPQVAVASDEDEFNLKTKQYSQKVALLAEIQTQLDKAVADYSAASANYEIVAKKVQDKRDAYQKAQNEYDQAIKSIELIPDDQLAQLTQEYKRTKKELTDAENELKAVENEKKYSQNLISGLLDQKKQKEQEILVLKADLFDISQRMPLWVEGYGEAILDENKTPSECQKLALDYAMRDAVEKGGKAVIESVTKVEMFELVKDDIKVTAKVQVLEQDSSGDYGKAKRVISGETIKYTAKVRIKIQNINTYNPYREQLNGAGQKSEIPANSSSQTSGTQNLPLEKPEDTSEKNIENKIMTPEKPKQNNTKRHQEGWMDYLVFNLPMIYSDFYVSFEDRVCYEYKSGVSLGIVGGLGFGYNNYFSLGFETGYDLPLGTSSYLTFSGTVGGGVGDFDYNFCPYLKVDIGFKTKFFTNIQLDCFGQFGPCFAAIGTRLMVGIPLSVKK